MKRIELSADELWAILYEYCPKPDVEIDARCTYAYIYEDDTLYQFNWYGVVVQEEIVEGLFEYVKEGGWYDEEEIEN